MSAPREPSNLAKLEADILGFKGKFLDLLQSSSALKYEVGKARRELVANGIYLSTSRYAAMGMGMPRELSLPMGMEHGIPVSSLAMRRAVGFSWVSPEAGDAYSGYDGFDEGWGYE